MTHIPVLRKQVIQYLDPRPNENFIDCTLGNGGHSLVILERVAPNGKVLGIDWEKSMTKLEVKNLITVHGNYADLEKIVKQNKFKPVHGILIDLGMSTWHIKESGKGFSFLRDEELDMRYNSEINSLTAKEILNTYSEKQLTHILVQHGEEKFAQKIAESIVTYRKRQPINTTFQLVDIIKKSVPAWYIRQRIHPATKTFQSLRITVNQEIENLKNVLPQAMEILSPGGRLGVISFHSIEDRMVKNFFKAVQDQAEILTKKPIQAKKQEVLENPSSRSAKLRVIRKK